MNVNQGSGECLVLAGTRKPALTYPNSRIIEFLGPWAHGLSEHP